LIDGSFEDFFCVYRFVPGTLRRNALRRNALRRNALRRSALRSGRPGPRRQRHPYHRAADVRVLGWVNPIQQMLARLALRGRSIPVCEGRIVVKRCADPVQRHGLSGIEPEG
jgi:hypothetical protein